MLNRKFIIRQGITGIDPDKDEKPQLKEWFKRHPVFEPSEKQKKHLEKILKKEVFPLRKNRG